MSSVFLQEPMAFGVNAKSADNSFVTSKQVSLAMNATDLSSACTMLNEMHDRLEKEVGIKGPLVVLRRESRREHYLYEDKGEAFGVSDAISFHAFTNADGKVTRRLAILYPMSRFRQGELANKTVVKRCLEAAGEDKLEVIDLRGFEKEGKYLEGTGAVVFSHDGKFAYMSRSSRTNDEVFDVLCSPENLNIPAENRFVFTSAIHALIKNDRNELVPDMTRKAPAHHTSLLGWCGKDICAWAIDHLVFDSEKEQNRFYDHLESNFKEVLELNDAELRAFAGNAIELTTRTACGAERRVLCISEGAFAAMQGKKVKLVQSWYGADNILTFYSDAIERRCGTSVQSCIASTHVVGSAIPNADEVSVIDASNIGRSEQEKK